MALHFDADTRTLQSVRRFVRGLIVAYGGSEEDAFAVEIATGEVLINAYEHGYARQSGPIEIGLRYDEEKVELIIDNHGKPIADAPAIPSSPPDGGRGRGLYLVGQLTDESEVIPHRSGRTGVGVRLAKYLRRRATNAHARKQRGSGSPPSRGGT